MIATLKPAADVAQLRFHVLPELVPLLQLRILSYHHISKHTIHLQRSPVGTAYGRTRRQQVRISGDIQLFLTVWSKKCLLIFFNRKNWFWLKFKGIC